MENQLKVLVTGASRGIGRSICQRLCDEGYAVAGIARTRPADWPDSLPFHTVDLTERDAVRAVLAEIAASGPYYGLVNNVGVSYFIDPRCGFVTGQTHYVCGGITIGAA